MKTLLTRPRQWVAEIIDFISDFIKAHEKVSIDLITTNQFLDLVTEKVDVAIGFGTLKNSNFIAKRLGTSSRLIVASPRYLTSAAPQHPRDLHQHKCILFKSASGEIEWHLIN